MHHRNAPLTVVGRKRPVARAVGSGRPIARIAAELLIARAALAKWVGRFLAHGELGLHGHSSASALRPSRLPFWMLDLCREKAEADLMIKCGRRSSRTSSSSSSKRWDSLVVVPGRCSSLISACTTQFLRVLGLIPRCSPAWRIVPDLVDGSRRG